MQKKLIKILVGVCVFFTAFIIVLPWVVYWYSLSLVEGRPAPASNRLTTAEVRRVWAENERYLKKENLDQITPYWFYKFMVYATANDSLGIEIAGKRISEGTSQMAGFVAIWYLRDGHFKGRRMLWWHISGMSLSIWLQRNWSPEQLAASYIEWKDYVTSRDIERSKKHNHEHYR